MLPDTAYEFPGRSVGESMCTGYHNEWTRTPNEQYHGGEHAEPYDACRDNDDSKVRDSRSRRTD